MQLSERQIKIVNNLLSSSEPLTTRELSEKFKVSVRTIKYDLSGIKPWINDSQEILISKRNKGFWLDANQDKRMELKKKLLNRDKFNYFPQPMQRAKQIIVLFGLTDGFMTTQQLENKLGVSKTTVLSDLNNAELELAKFNITLVRKNYYGYTISGSEANIRSALEEIVQHTINSYDLTTVMNLFVNDALRPQLGIASELETIYQQLFQTIQTLNKNPRSQLDYNDILTIVIRLGISVARLSINQPINSYRELVITDADKGQVPYRLFDQTFSYYDFPLLQDEYTYVISGTNPSFKDKNIANLTEKIMAFVSESTHHPYQDDNQLRTNLFSHLMMKLTSEYKFTNEYNPFVDEIKQKYPILFSAIYEVTKQEISTNPAVVNESFVAFIALHFLVSLEKYVENNRNVRIVYVCSTGLGVTNLIQQKIEAALTGVEIAGFASFINAKAEVARLKPDLVISIFPLKLADVPVIEVHPLPSNEDIALIKKKITDLKLASVDLLTPSKNLQLADESKQAEEISRDLMIKAFTVYEEVKKIVGKQINDKYRDAFMLHVLMSVHRIYYNQQYNQKLSNVPDKAQLMNAIKLAYAHNNLMINDSELVAIIEYLKFS
ncbi:MAG: HTH domain-containing protein [Bacillota bacterium]|nr:HTH domain-containing protein [Bacillota bacterium]